MDYTDKKVTIGGRQRRKPSVEFKPGDKVEFQSNSLEGKIVWKPGVVESIPQCRGGKLGVSVRIYVGNDVYIVRSMNRCRKVDV